VCNDQDAEDIVSETFIYVAARIQDYDAEKGSLKARVLSIANYKFLDKMRKVYKEKVMPVDESFDP
jgi:DNA-directed RNA polymerase specialized sigma24 family protein